jgi:NedA-like, galactose-binding domain/F5/8 type C domain/Glycosyl hydrolases family 16
MMSSLVGSPLSQRPHAPRRLYRVVLALLCCVLLISLMIGVGGAAAQTTNLALNHPVTVSSNESITAFPPAAAVDGNLGTRWSSAFSDPQWIRVDLGSTQSIGRVVLRWEAAYGRAYQIQVSNNDSTWTTIFNTTTGDGGVDDLIVSGSGRYVRMYGTVRATQYGYSLWEFEVYGSGGTPTATATRTATPTAGTCGATNAALNHAVTASAVENGGTPASAAVDGNLGTRWSSAFSDPQWIRVDLGATVSICRVVLRWEAAYGRAYQIQVSNNDSTWTTIFNTTTGDGGVDDLIVSGSGRYVRMYGTVRATQYGYSLWEFEVYGSGGTPTATATSAPTPTRTATPTPTRTATPPPSGSCTTTSNIALNQPTYAWYYEMPSEDPSKATDGNMNTRWGHLWYPAGPANAWLDVDLGSNAATITQVQIFWENALAADYQIQTSNDRVNWTTVRSVTNNAALNNTLTFSPAVTGRYLRVNMTRKGTAYGYSIWELQVIGCNGAPASYPPPPSPLTGTFTRVWFDNFDGTTLNTSNWGYDNNVHVNGEVEQYTANNVTVSGGTLKLTARKEVVNGYPFTSGRIFTKGLRNWTYGKIVARMKLPVGEGYWPAFWMMGENIDQVGWPGNGELDIMENIGYANWVSGALHGPNYWGGGSVGGQNNLPAGQTIAAFHNYAVEWDPTYITWLIDDVPVRTVTRQSVIDNYGQWVYDNPKFIILNLALGGDYPHGYNNVTSPYYGLPQSTVDNIVAGSGVVEVDYVEVWQRQ